MKGILDSVHDKMDALLQIHSMHLMADQDPEKIFLGVFIVDDGQFGMRILDSEYCCPQHAVMYACMEFENFCNQMHGKSPTLQMGCVALQADRVIFTRGFEMDVNTRITPDYVRKHGDENWSGNWPKDPHDTGPDWNLGEVMGMRPSGSSLH